MKDLYKTLGVAENAGEDEIRRAYVEYSRRCAPWRFEAPQFESLRKELTPDFVPRPRPDVSNAPPEMFI